jgi:hypothetical protein
MRSSVVGCVVVLAALSPAAHASWAAPESLQERPDAHQRAPAIARNAPGDTVAAWVSSPVAAGAGAGRVHLAQRRAGSSAWSRVGAVSRPGVGAPAAAVSPRGAAIVAWGRGGRVEVAMRTGRNARWRTLPAGAGPGHVTDVAVAVDASGAMAVMWAEAIGGTHRVRRALLAPGAMRFRQGAAGLIAERRAALVTGAAGNGAAAWTARGRVVLAIATPLGFSRPLAIDAGDSLAPALAMGSGGRLVVAWRSRLPGGTTVLGAALREPDGRLRNLGDVGLGRAARVAMNPRGDAAIVWPATDGGGDRSGIQALLIPRGARGMTTIVVPRSTCACRYAVADAALDGDGGLLVAWRRHSRHEADIGAVTSVTDAGPRRALIMRPAPDVAAADLATDGASGAAALWTAGGRVAVSVRSGAR